MAVSSSASASMSNRPKEYIDGCLNTWETGGRNQVRDALLNGLRRLSLPSYADEDLLTALIYALLSRHAFQPQLPPSTLSVLFRDVLDSIQRDEEPKASSSRDPSPASSNSDTGHPSPLIDVLLDVIWTIDYEIESRKDVATQAKSTRLFNNESRKEDEGTLEEQAMACKARLVDLVRELLSHAILTRRSISERLEVPLLAKIGLVDDATLFNKKGVRINTATLYKQQKFNLLREENEGYSGLVNEIVGGMGPPIRAVRGGSQSQDRVVEQETAEERNTRARRVMNNITALIGYFDLDPNRVLDITLDIFSSNVVLHWPFFLSLLVASPWGKGKGRASAFEPALESAMNVDVSNGDHFGPVNVNIKSDGGHDIIAQVLGFKFGHYQQVDVTETIPEELYLMAAILIREGHVRFLDLYGHLSPDEKGLTALHDKYKQSMSDKVMSAKGNALSLAAPLTEEGAGLTEAGANGKKDGGAGGQGNVQHNLPNQILGLLRALLGIGELRCALFILGRYPWLCGAYPHIADLYSRLLIVVIEPAYSTISINSQIPVASNPSIAIPKLRYDSKKQELVQIPKPTNRVTSLAPEPQATMTNRFIYFYGPWRERLPRCSVTNLLGDLVPLLRILGPHLYRNQILFQQVCRLSRVGLRTAANQASDQSAWLEVVRNFLLPALTMTSGNSGLVSEVWVVLRQLPYTSRYNLYGEWKYALYKRPELRARQAETEKEAKGILKRISSDNLKLSGRSLAKSSHTNPTIFFTVALNQVQSYSNLIAPIVESAKFLTHFEYDVFGFNLIDALSNPEKERTKQDGTSVSMWLQSLAAFTGTLYRRYAMMDCSPVLQYIANQLKENNSKDLVIVRELILKMAGIEPLANLSDNQVAALTGGRQLRMEAMMIANANIATPTRVALRKSGARLLLALTESRMAIPLLILIAQQRQACVHLVDSGEAHLKYLGNLFDTCQEILFQYVEFLHNQLDPQAYSDLVPKLNDLCSRFELEPAIAFHIVRPRLVMTLRAVEAKEREERLRREVLASKSQTANKTSLAAVGEEKEQRDEVMKDAAIIEETFDEKKDVEMIDGEGELPTIAPESVKMEVTEKEPEEAPLKRNEEKEVQVVWKAGLEEAIQAAENILPEETKDLIGVHFYATFWQLSLADISVPTDRYDQEIRALQQIIEKNPEGARKSIHKARIQAQEMSSLLRSELKEQTIAHTATRKRLQLEKDHWIPNQPGQSSTIYRQSVVFELMQHCFVPRALLSPTDAIFAGRILRAMHSAGTRNFSSLTAYDKIITDEVGPLVFSCTENEIRNYARFLQIILGDLNSWYKDENRYIKEAHGDNLPGFQMKWGDRRGGETIPKEDLLSFEKYKTVMVKWHGTLRSIFRECLESKEYMRIRNTIVVMTRIAGQFPLWENHGIEMLDAIKTMTQVEDRGDLKILGQGLLATLKKQQKIWIPKKKAVVVDVAATAATATAAAAPPPPPPSESVAVAKNAPLNNNTTIKTDPAATANVKAEESKSLTGDKVNGNKTSNREPGETSPPRESSRKPSVARDSTPSTMASRSAASTGGSAPSPSVMAARQAALESRNNANGMNPPRAVASTASAQASRDRQASHQREVTTSSSSSRGREKETGKSRSNLSSRETSPVNQAKAGAELSDTRKGSRAESEETASRSSRGDRDRERERDRDRNKDKDREKDRTSSGRRERDVLKDRHSSTREERERDRSRRDREGRSDRSYDDRNRDSDRDRLNAVEGKAESEGRLPPTEPRFAKDGERRPSDYNRDRRDSKDNSRNTSSSSQQAQPPPPPPPKEPAANRNNREILSKVDAEMKEENGEKSPASIAKKRSLADRLASNNGEVSSPTPSTKEGGPTRINEEEPNKRPRINRNRITEEDVLSSKEEKSRSSREPSAAAAGGTQGISIQGQGRSSGPPQFNRRDSRNANYNRGGYDSNHQGREDYQHQDRDRNQASRNGSGSHRGNDRSVHGKERDQRRRERRSGQD